jgi:hypothetical protein
MTKEEFIQQYIVQFMASYAAVNYADACCMGAFGHLHRSEDAERLAEKAWDDYVLYTTRGRKTK